MILALCRTFMNKLLEDTSCIINLWFFFVVGLGSCCGFLHPTLKKGLKSHDGLNLFQFFVSHCFKSLQLVFKFSFPVPCALRHLLRTQHSRLQLSWFSLFNSLQLTLEFGDLFEFLLVNLVLRLHPLQNTVCVVESSVFTDVLESLMFTLVSLHYPLSLALH